MEGFITRRGGGSSYMLSTTFKGKNSNTITLPELISAKCFCIVAESMEIHQGTTRIMSLSHFDGETSCIQGYGYIDVTDQGTRLEKVYTLTFNHEAFNSTTGTINASAEFVSDVTYHLWASF